MNKYSLGIALITVVLASRLTGAKLPPFTCKVDLSVQTGRLSFNDELGRGRLYRGALTFGFKIARYPVTFLEIGPGMQYYDKDFQGLPSDLVWVPEVTPTVTKDELKDIYPFLMLRMRFPLTGFSACYVGAIGGWHFIDKENRIRVEETGQPSYYFDNSYEYRIFGYDVFLGVRLKLGSFPLGIQGEYGYEYIGSKIESGISGIYYPDTWSNYIALGFYLEH